MPVIIPMMMPQQEKKCIIQQGVRYCEDTPITKHEFGAISIFIILIIIWSGILMKLLSEEYNKLAIIWLLLPFIIGAIVGFLC